MFIEIEYDPDGRPAWILYRMGRHVGSVCKVGRARWQLNDSDGAILGIFRTRGQAIKHAEDAAILGSAKLRNEMGATDLPTPGARIGWPG